MSWVAEARVGLNVDKLLPVVIARNVEFFDLFKSYLCERHSTTGHRKPRIRQ